MNASTSASAQEVIELSSSGEESDIQILPSPSSFFRRKIVSNVINGHTPNGPNSAQKRINGLPNGDHHQVQSRSSFSTDSIDSRFVFVQLEQMNESRWEYAQLVDPDVISGAQQAEEISIKFCSARNGQVVRRRRRFVAMAAPSHPLELQCLAVGRDMITNEFRCGLVLERTEVQKQQWRYLIMFFDGNATYSNAKETFRVLDQRYTINDFSNSEFLRYYVDNYPNVPKTSFIPNLKERILVHNAWIRAWVEKCDESLVKFSFDMSPDSGKKNNLPNKHNSFWLHCYDFQRIRSIQLQHSMVITPSSDELQVIGTFPSSLSSSSSSSSHTLFKLNGSAIKTSNNVLRRSNNFVTTISNSSGSGCGSSSSSNNSIVSFRNKIEQEPDEKRMRLQTARKSFQSSYQTISNNHSATSTINGVYSAAANTARSALLKATNQQFSDQIETSASFTSAIFNTTKPNHGERRQLVIKESDLNFRKEVDFNYRMSLENNQGPLKSQLDLIDVRQANPLTIPIFLGWKREKGLDKGGKKEAIFYVAPCGKRINNYSSLRTYLAGQNANELEVDMFSFERSIRVQSFLPQLKRFCFRSDRDISKGKEPVMISVVNEFSREWIESNFEYIAKRRAHESVTIPTDTEFLSCCSCTNDCSDPETCECQRVTRDQCKDMPQAIQSSVWSYKNRRLMDRIVTGIYECNSRCSCSRRCYNRVVQNGIRNRLQVFRTEKKGWGVRVLHDIPKGAFVCGYSGIIYSDHMANQLGQQGTDKYLTDLDMIDVYEETKEGFEQNWGDLQRGSFMNNGNGNASNVKNSNGGGSAAGAVACTSGNGSASQLNPYINTSSAWRREHRRGPIRARDYVKTRHLFNETEPYAMDGQKSGNVGRFLNHSCSPNLFVQSVFVDTHDLRFPWVAFFAKCNIPAMSELTWDYGYAIDSVAGCILKCHCGAEDCRGRLL